MKKTLSLAMVMAVVCWSVCLSAVNFVYAGEVPITENNLAQLKGKWEGERSVATTFGSPQYFRTVLEVTNDSFPLEGKIIFYLRMGEPNEVEFKNGVLRKGRIFIEGESVRDWREFYLFEKKGKLELRGEFQTLSRGGVTLIGDYFLQKKNTP